MSLMAQAGLNTLMGMGIVFLSLIFISFIIRLFALIPKLQEKAAKKKETAVSATPEAGIQNAVETITANEENLTDDTELVAVITAAIMAAMGSEAPADGLVVRSIRRRA